MKTKRNRKKETKLQELERRIKNLEINQYNPMVQIPNLPPIPRQIQHCPCCGA